MPLRLLADISLHKDIRSLQEPIETVTVHKTIHKKRRSIQINQANKVLKHIR